MENRIAGRRQFMEADRVKEPIQARQLEPPFRDLTSSIHANELRNTQLIGRRSKSAILLSDG